MHTLCQTQFAQFSEDLSMKITVTYFYFRSDHPVLRDKTTFKNINTKYLYQILDQLDHYLGLLAFSVEK